MSSVFLDCVSRGGGAARSNDASPPGRWAWPLQLYASAEADCKFGINLVSSSLLTLAEPLAAMTLGREGIGAGHYCPIPEQR